MIISYDFMEKPKTLLATEFKKKLIKIFIHGFLHLLNYDHIKLKDYKIMNNEEIKIYKFVNKKIEKLI
jgi:probable rRNA maturation factor